MSVACPYKTITVTDGVNYVIDPLLSVQLYRITGTVALTSNWAITVSAGATDGMYHKFIYDANVTLAGNHIYICSAMLPDNLATKNVLVEALYNGSSWIVNFSPDFEAASIVATDDIMDDAVTNDKLSNMTRGTIKVGGVADAPTDLTANGSGKILIGDGTDIASKSISGDATLTSAGVLTIANDAIDNNKLANIARGYIKVGGVADAPTDLNAKTSGNILIGNGTDVVSVPVTGDISITSGGVVTIINNKIKADASDPTADYLDGKVGGSIIEDVITHTIVLEGDDVSPGNYMFYGTNAVGSKSWTSRPLEYFAYLTQTSTNPPTALEVYSQFGTVTFLRSGVGTYTLHCAGTFIPNKTFIMINPIWLDGSGIAGYITAERSSSDDILIKTYSGGAPGTLADDCMSGIAILIKVDPS